MSSGGIPYGELDALLLDAGNTLASMDFGWIRDELTTRRVECTVEALRRAEAGARPALSAALEGLGSTERRGTFVFYLRAILERLETTPPLSPDAAGSLADELASVLRSHGSSRLWSWPLPGVRDALESLRGLGLRLVVVSNSDGTCEETLAEGGLREYFDAVVDSHRVGFEKPDPRIFECALSLTGSARERTLHVGDIYSVDVIGAHRAGIHALLLDPYGDWTAATCERLPDLGALHGRIAGARGTTA
jgi:HAD superfamily hydrolase (TIGR01509 family)